MLNLLLAGIIFNNMGTNNLVSTDKKSPEDKTVDEIMWFTCPHCTETYDIDYIEEDGLCPVCGMDIEDFDIEGIEESLNELQEAIFEVKESFDALKEQLAQINKRIKDLENK